jgi:hypothetical protein
VEAAYDRAAGEMRLSRINRLFLDLVCGWLRIETAISSSQCYPDHPDRVERLIAICHAAGAERYLSGPKARAYIDPRRFEEAGIQVEFRDYSAYYREMPALSMMDRVLHQGAEAAWR